MLDICIKIELNTILDELRFNEVGDIRVEVLSKAVSGVYNAKAKTEIVQAFDGLQGNISSTQNHSGPTRMIRDIVLDLMEIQHRLEKENIRSLDARHPWWRGMSSLRENQFIVREPIGLVRVRLSK